MTARRPIVYLGPSLGADEARALLPGAEIRPPARRGDLYRDRVMDAAALVLVDGVFFQEQAVPPREVVDVLGDGALVAGASSMGALRAAECWPAGMKGYGLVYRLFRAGVLDSDDEVAVAHEAGNGFRALSVPLVNVRFAVRRAIREGLLDREAARRVVDSARRLFYADRRWRPVLAGAGVADPGGRIEAFVSRHDLKANDARRALAAVAGMLAREPELPARLARKREGPFATSEETRERPHDPLAGWEPEEAKRELARWHLASGRYVRHLPALALADPDGEHAPRSVSDAKKAALQAERFLQDEGWFATPERSELLARAHRLDRLARAAFLRQTLSRRIAALVASEAEFAESLWAELAFSGELAAELHRLRAVRDAAREALRLSLSPCAADRHAAECEIAAAHGFGSWLELREVAEQGPIPWPWVEEARERLARARRMREALFHPGTLLPGC